jgi:hypothetical protein
MALESAWKAPNRPGGARRYQRTPSPICPDRTRGGQVTRDREPDRMNQKRPGLRRSFVLLPPSNGVQNQLAGLRLWRDPGTTSRFSSSRSSSILRRRPAEMIRPRLREDREAKAAAEVGAAAASAGRAQEECSPLDRCDSCWPPWRVCAMLEQDAAESPSHLCCVFRDRNGSFTDQ